eukprot:COSAG02_NODE_34047_length_490_cov_1.043478_1_plen_69_part_10
MKKKFSGRKKRDGNGGLSPLLSPDEIEARRAGGLRRSRSHSNASEGKGRGAFRNSHKNFSEITGSLRDS